VRYSALVLELIPQRDVAGHLLEVQERGDQLGVGWFIGPRNCVTGPRSSVTAARNRKFGAWRGNAGENISVIGEKRSETAENSSVAAARRRNNGVQRRVIAPRRCFVAGFRWSDGVRSRTRLNRRRMRMQTQAVKVGWRSIAPISAAR
jgi:hypothetical protein